MPATHDQSIPEWIKSCWTVHQSRIAAECCAVEWTDAMDEWERCWCCGKSKGKRLQRCHIVAKSIGGTDKPQNIVPLCHCCHDLMPDTPDSDYFWKWIQQQQNPFSGLGAGHLWPLWQSTVDALTSSDLDHIDADAVIDRMRNNIEQIATHWAQSGSGPVIKITSMQWAIEAAINQRT